MKKTAFILAIIVVFMIINISTVFAEDYPDPINPYNKEFVIILENKNQTYYPYTLLTVDNAYIIIEDGYTKLFFYNGYQWNYHEDWVSESVFTGSYAVKLHLDTWYDEIVYSNKDIYYDDGTLYKPGDELYINIINPSPWETIYNQDYYIEINTNYEYWKVGAFKCQYENDGGTYHIKLDGNGNPDWIQDGSGGTRSYNPYDLERFYAENLLWVINGENKKIKLSDLGVFDDGTYVLWYMAFTLDENGEEVAADRTYYSDIYFNYQEIVYAGSNDIVVTGIESNRTYYENVFYKIKKYGTSQSISLDIKLNDNLMFSDLKLPMYSLSLYGGRQSTDYRLVGENNLKIINHETQEVIYEYDFELLPGLKPDGTPNTTFNQTGIPNQNNQWDVIGFFDSIFKMIKSTVLLFDRATIGVSQNNNGLLIKMATIEKNNELLNDNTIRTIEFFKNIDLTLYGVSYNLYDLFMNVMSFLFGLFMIRRIKNVGLKIQDSFTNTFEKVRNNFRG